MSYPGVQESVCSGACSSSYPVAQVEEQPLCLAAVAQPPLHVLGGDFVSSVRTHHGARHCISEGTTTKHQNTHPPTRTWGWQASNHT